MAQRLLYHDGIVFLKASSSHGLPIFLKVTTNWRAECEKFARSVRWEGRSWLRPYPYLSSRCEPPQSHAGTPTRPYAPRLPTAGEASRLPFEEEFRLEQRISALSFRRCFRAAFQVVARLAPGNLRSRPKANSISN